MSSGGSSGFPSTPAPTPFTFHPGGVRPEDLAAGISRLSVIEEVDGHPHQQHHHHQQQQKVSIRVVMDESGRISAQGSQNKIEWDSENRTCPDLNWSKNSNCGESFKNLFLVLF